VRGKWERGKRAEKEGGETGRRNKAGKQGGSGNNKRALRLVEVKFEPLKMDKVVFKQLIIIIKKPL